MRSKHAVILTFMLVLSLMFNLVPAAASESAATDYGDDPKRILFVSVTGSD